MHTNESNLVSEAMADGRSDERQAAWNVLRTSPTVRMLAALAGPYWPQPTARETDRRAARQPAVSRVSSCIERREALLDNEQCLPGFPPRRVGWPDGWPDFSGLVCHWSSWPRSLF